METKKGNMINNQDLENLMNIVSLNSNLMEAIKSIKSKNNESSIKALKALKDKPGVWSELLITAMTSQNFKALEFMYDNYGIDLGGSLEISPNLLSTEILQESNSIAKNLFSENKEKDNYTSVKVPLGIVASISGDIDIFHYVKEKGANITANGHIGLSKKHKNSIVSNILGAAAFYGRGELTDYILKKHAVDVNYKCSEKKVKKKQYTNLLKEYSEMTPLLLAVVSDAPEDMSIEVMKFLLEKNANINSVDYNKNTFLHLAVRYNKFGIIKHFVDYIPQFIGLANRDGETPLAIAQESGLNDIINFLKSNFVQEQKEKNIEEELNQLIELNNLQRNKKKKQKQKKDKDEIRLLNSSEFDNTYKFKKPNQTAIASIATPVIKEEVSKIQESQDLEIDTTVKSKKIIKTQEKEEYANNDYYKYDTNTGIGEEQDYYYNARGINKRNNYYNDYIYNHDENVNNYDYNTNYTRSYDYYGGYGSNTNKSNRYSQNYNKNPNYQTNYQEGRGYYRKADREYKYGNKTINQQTSDKEQKIQEKDIKVESVNVSENTQIPEKNTNVDDKVQENIKNLENNDASLATDKKQVKTIAGLDAKTLKKLEKKKDKKKTEKRKMSKEQQQAQDKETQDNIVKSEANEPNNEVVLENDAESESHPINKVTSDKNSHDVDDKTNENIEINQDEHKQSIEEPQAEEIPQAENTIKENPIFTEAPEEYNIEKEILVSEEVEQEKALDEVVEKSQESLHKEKEVNIENTFVNDNLLYNKELIKEFYIKKCLTLEEKIEKEKCEKEKYYYMMVNQNLKHAKEAIMRKQNLQDHSEEKIEDLLHLANKELESKAIKINELNSRLEYFELKNVRSLSKEKLNELKNIYSTKLGLIIDALNNLK